MSKSDLGLRRVAPAVWRYGLSVLSVAISTAITIPLEGFGVRVSFFFPAVLLSTWFGGTGPGLLAVLLSTLSINFFFTEPFLAFQFSVRDIPTTVAFLASALIISSWSTARQRAEKNLRRSEGFLAEGQRISHTGSWSWNVSSGKVAWSEEHFRIFGFDPEKTEP